MATRKPATSAAVPPSLSPDDNLPEVSPYPPNFPSPSQSLLSANDRRIPSAVTVGLLTGLTLGISHGSRMTGLRFRAEHAHRLPTSTSGWYLYHKSKNYHVMIGAVREGLKGAVRIGAWTGLLFTIEQLLAVERGRVDFLNTVAAGVGAGGCFSLWNRFSMTAATRTTRLGLYAGVSVGVATDLIRAARGNEPWYFERLRALGRRRTANEAGCEPG